MILLTGATGYIGSHTWLALQAAGEQVVGVDNFCNSWPVVLRRLATLGADVSRFVEADIQDCGALDPLFSAWSIDAVVHFAALKAVGESMGEPLHYYASNVGGLIALAQVMRSHACKTIVFSSSATVYGQPERLPIQEDVDLVATSPYGATKLVGEGILRDLARADSNWRIAILRYFNPAGAHPSGTIGEDPCGPPNNLMPYVAQVAVGKLPRLRVFGDDYPTADGTGVRDYLHVSDLAEGHVAALARLRVAGSHTMNLGSGNGTSVLELVRAFERASGLPIPYEIVARRPGDIASCYADPSLAESLLGWKARRSLDKICEDSWRWQSTNPNGYAPST